MIVSRRSWMRTTSPQRDSRSKTLPGSNDKRRNLAGLQHWEYGLTQREEPIGPYTMAWCSDRSMWEVRKRTRPKRSYVTSVHDVATSREPAKSKAGAASVREIMNG